MAQLLDLIIELTPRPEDAPANVISYMAVRCDNLSFHQDVGLLVNPLADLDHPDDLKWYFEEYPLWPYEGFAERGKRIEAQLSKIGQRLYQAVFGGVPNLTQRWQAEQAIQKQISIVSTVPSALNLPWELLHDGQDFLILRQQTPIGLVRRLYQAQEKYKQHISFTPPLRILMVIARPSDQDFLDSRSLARELLDAVETQISDGSITVEFLRPPTRDMLRYRLSQTRHPVHLLHFDGHGFLTKKMGQQGESQGILAFENEAGETDLIKAEELTELLQNSSVKLVALDACQSAQETSSDALSSVAARLIQGGINATVAMSASVFPSTSTRFFATFYQELVTGTPASLAMERARQGLATDPRRHAFQWRTDEEGQSIELCDWWLPHYYQQQPLTLGATRKARPHPFIQTDIPARLNDKMPPPPRYHFTGRSWEMHQIEHALLCHQLVVLSGFGGIGKTALAREAADWFTRTGLYISACFISFEYGGDATMLLSELGHFLSVNDHHYNPTNSDEALVRLKRALRVRPTLVVADNLESILPTGQTPLQQVDRKQLWRVLRRLTRLGAGVLLTTRSPLENETLLTPGDRVFPLSLLGLLPTDAYALATQLLENLAIPRIRAPYNELCDLLIQLDHYPLAIQLVLPMLRERTLDTICTEFTTLLSNFTDDHAEGRNRSLLASLNYSLSSLSPTQRALLLRLAYFERGANEKNLLAITQIPDITWVNLRPALEQAALLTPVMVSGVTGPFLHFHPMLTPFLRSQLNKDDLPLYNRFAQRYMTFANHFYDQDKSSPQIVRILVHQELPNIRKALAFFLETGNLDDATILADRIIYFLMIFGRRRECDMLRQHMVDVIASQQTIAKEGLLTGMELIHESGLGEDEFTNHNFKAATIRFTRLLDCIEVLPVGTPFSRGSLNHAVTLMRLSRCLKWGGHPTEGKLYLLQAISVITTLCEQEPTNITYIRHLAGFTTDLANILVDEGLYDQAHRYYIEALKLKKNIGDVRGQAVTEGQLGVLALEKHNIAEARTHCLMSLHIFQVLKEPALEATAWHRLGRVAEEQKLWAEAERFYRESLTIKEHIGDVVGAAESYHQLAIVAQHSGRLIEAGGWYRSAFQRFKQMQSEDDQAAVLYKTAQLLLDEGDAGHIVKARLTQAKSYVEQALTLNKTSEIDPMAWIGFALLDRIAILEGQTEVARYYRRKTFDSYAAFVDSNFQTNYQYGRIIADIVAGAQGYLAAQAAIKAALPQIEIAGWQIATVTYRIWAGERDWNTLTESLNSEESLLIYHVLETIVALEDPLAQPVPEALLGSSLRHLTNTQRAWLPRLAIFEGGANENDFLTITQIPEEEWIKLRQLLEQVALLIPEQVPGINLLFLRFHPVLIPYLRSQNSRGTVDATQYARFIQQYTAMVYTLYNDDVQHPQAVRALFRLEFPNLRQILVLLLEMRELDKVGPLAHIIGHFLTILGQWHERDRLRQLVATVLEEQQDTAEELTYAEFQQECDLGEDERSRGNLLAATDRFSRLLKRIESSPIGTPFGMGTYEHSQTLGKLACCLRDSKQLATAERYLNQALGITDVLLQQQPENSANRSLHSSTITILANILEIRGQYQEAYERYEEALAIVKQLGEQSSQAVIMGNLGTLALRQGNDAEAQARYLSAMQTFQTLGEMPKEAMMWHQLGIVAQLQKNWSEAERCYHKSLAISEHLGNAAVSAKTCNQLGLVAVSSGRPVEAENWYKRALELDEQIQSGRSDTTYLNNLATLLVQEIQSGHISTSRLDEAKKYVEQALAINEADEESQDVWNNFALLAQIATLQNQTEIAHHYSRCEQKAFAASTNNRNDIDRQVGSPIVAIAAAAQGNKAAQQAAEEILPRIEIDGWQIAAATYRIWTGERDWGTLVEGLDARSALCILRILELLAVPEESLKQYTSEELLASLPTSLRNAFIQKDQAAFARASIVFPLEEQRRVQMVRQRLLELKEEENLTQYTSEDLLAYLPTSLQDALLEEDQVAFIQALEVLPPEEQQRVQTVLQRLLELEEGENPEEQV